MSIVEDSHKDLHASVENVSPLSKAAMPHGYVRANQKHSSLCGPESRFRSRETAARFLLVETWSFYRYDEYFVP